MGIFWNLGKSFKKSVLRCFIYRNSKNVIVAMWRTIFFKILIFATIRHKKILKFLKFFFFEIYKKKLKNRLKWSFFEDIFFQQRFMTFQHYTRPYNFCKIFLWCQSIAKIFFFWYTKGTCRNFWNVPFVCKYLKFCRLKNQY